MTKTHTTISDAIRDRASLFSLGMLDPKDAARFESHIAGCPVCASQVKASVALLSDVGLMFAEEAAEKLPTTEPSARIKDALMRSISSDESMHASVITPASNDTVSGEEPTPAIPLETVRPEKIVRADAGVWRTIFPGVEVKRLFIDPMTRNVTSLVRVAAGAVYPAHLHAGIEHLYVLDGDAIFDDHTLNTGDYEVRHPHSRHSATTTSDGCLLLVINNQRDKVI